MRTEAEHERYKKLLADYQAKVWIEREDWLWFWRQYKYDVYKRRLWTTRRQKLSNATKFQTFGGHHGTGPR